jgi:hypothetical protein
MVNLFLWLGFNWQISRMLEPQATNQPTAPVIADPPPKPKLHTFVTSRHRAVNFFFGGNLSFMSLDVDGNMPKQFPIETQDDPQPLVIYAENWKLYVDAIFGGTMLRKNDLIDPAPGWDLNGDDKAMELVDTVGRPVLQVEYVNDNVLTVRGIFRNRADNIVAVGDNMMAFGPPERAIPVWKTIKPIFRHPASEFPGERIPPTTQVSAELPMPDPAHQSELWRKIRNQRNVFIRWRDMRTQFESRPQTFSQDDIKILNQLDFDVRHQASELIALAESHGVDGSDLKCLCESPNTQPAPYMRYRICDVLEKLEAAVLKPAQAETKPAQAITAAAASEPAIPRSAPTSGPTTQR